MWAHSWYSFVVPTAKRSEGPAVEFKVRSMSLRRTCTAAWYALAHPCPHERNFPKHMERILHLKTISVDVHSQIK